MRLGFVMLLLASAVAARAQENVCGALANPYGPFDYRTDKPMLPIVDNAHFTPQVENLIRGQSGNLGGDLDYTLRAFPNHHRALIAVMNYGLKTGSPQPPHLPRPVECYFERAIRFRPDDYLVRLIYVDFLRRHQRPGEAIAQLDSAAALSQDRWITQQNIGLIYVELKEFEKARACARRVFALGERPDRLVVALREAGHWSDADDAALPAADTASASR